MREIVIAKNLDELSRLAADRFVHLANKSNEENRWFTVALAGGSTPRSFYSLLASREYREKIDWAKVFFFFGDERFVPHDNAESNYRMAKETLFDPLGVRFSNVFRWQTEIADPAQAAADYEKDIRAFFYTPESPPKFDLVLLGMGPDGHTASLFPYTAALTENSRIAVANPVEKLDTVRLTLTFPILNNAANVIFLVAGAEKAATLKEVIEGDRSPEKYPAQTIDPLDGNLVWLVDQPAADLLKLPN
jgi:6-phosphogluconolactonase